MERRTGTNSIVLDISTLLWITLRIIQLITARNVEISVMVSADSGHRVLHRRNCLLWVDCISELREPSPFFVSSEVRQSTWVFIGEPVLSTNLLSLEISLATARIFAAIPRISKQISKLQDGRFIWEVNHYTIEPRELVR